MRKAFSLLLGIFTLFAMGANTEVVLSLNDFSAMSDDVAYDQTTHVLTTTNGWTGMQLWIGDDSNYAGSSLVLKTTGQCKLKITVGYVGDTQDELTDDEATTEHAVSLDNTKMIQKIQVQNQEAGAVTFESAILDPEEEKQQQTGPERQSDETTVWEGDVAISWDADTWEGQQFDTYGVNADMFSALAAGDLIRITTMSEEGAQYNLVYKDDSWNWTSLEGFSISDAGVISYRVADADMAAAIASRGLVITGIRYHITKITVESSQTTDPDPTPVDPAEEAGTNAVILTLLADATGTASATDEDTQNAIHTSISNGIVTVTPVAGPGYTFSNVVVEQLANPSSADQAMLSLIRANAPAVGNYITATDNQDGTYSFQMPESAGVRILSTFDFTFLAPTLSYNGQTHVFTLTDANEADKDKAAKMYYSTDGKESWTEYTEGVTIDKNTTVWTKAVTTTNFEAVSEESQTFHVANIPTFGYENGVNTVTITLQEATDDYTAGTAIYYTLDGTEPTLQSSQATSGEPVSFPITTTVVKAMAIDADGNWSAVVEQEVEYARYLTVEKQWVTFYSPETFAVPEGLKAYTVSSVQYSEGEEGTLVLTEQNVIAAETPMLIENTTDSETSFRVYNSTNTITGTPCSEFKGTDTDMMLSPTNEQAYYVLVDGVFQRSTQGTLSARNCYLELSSSSSAAGARRFVMQKGDQTAIAKIAANAAGCQEWYGLDGMRVAQPRKGIYVNNGRKIVIR